MIYYNGNPILKTENTYLPLELVQEKGDSETKVMSQKAVTDEVSRLDFLNNVKLDYGYDEATGANYIVLRVFKDRLDGTKQYPLVYAPNGMSAGKYSTYDLVSKEHFPLAINAGVFDTSTTIPKGLLIQDGMLLQDSAVNNDVNKCKALTIDSDGNLSYVAWDANGADLVSNGIVSAVCGFMPIIVDFQPVPTSEWNAISHYPDNAQRQIIGQFGNGDYAIVTCEGRGIDNSDGWTISEAQNVCKKLGLKFAYNLDGGGSTETMLCNKHLNTIYEKPTGRKVPTFIVFNGTTQLDIEFTYTDLEFLQVSGAQYIDTGIPETEIYSTEYRVLNENWTNSAGHILSSKNAYTAFAKGTVGAESMIVKRGSYSYSGYNRYEFNITVTEPYTVKEEYDGAKITAYCNDKVMHSFTPDTSALSADNNYYFFAYGGNVGSANYRFTGKFYYLKLWDASGNLVHHYKPVQRLDGVCGLYDVVTQRFLTSASGTNF